jgi:hypothetical protein
MKSSASSLTVCALLCACTRAAPDPAFDTAAQASVAAASPARDSMWVTVRGPTLVAFWPANAVAALDSGGASASALDDFGYYLSAADSGLRSLGVRVVNVGGRTFHVVAGAATTSFSVPPDSSDIGYYLVAPGRAPEVYYGVQTDTDLLDAARQYIRTGGGRPSSRAPAP